MLPLLPLSFIMKLMV